MKKPIVIGSIIVGCMVIVGAIFGRTYIFKKTTTVIQPTVTAQPEQITTWNDPTGFSFQYPKDIQMNTHDEDTQNYAHLELTSMTHAGSMTIWAKDTTYPDVATWIQKDATLAHASSVDTTLGGKPAKRLIVPDPTKRIVIGTIDDDVLVTVEMDPGTEEAFWQTVYDQIQRTFTFVQPTEEQASAISNTNSSDMGVDEEEVLE